jgi:protein-S-isoprenylcysteine O-methyltransferase Ste14
MWWRRWISSIGRRRRGERTSVLVIPRQIVGDVVTGLWLAWAVYWFANAWGNKRTVERRGRAAQIILFAIGFVGSRIIASEPEYSFHLMRATIFSQVGGIGLCVVGLGFSIWARRFLGSNWSGNITLKENHELIRTGPYRFVRHPIYTGIILALVGTAVALDLTTSQVFFFSFLTIGLKVKSLGEEKIMQRHFGQAYMDYMSQVKALIPFVW